MNGIEYFIPVCSYHFAVCGAECDSPTRTRKVAIPKNGHLGVSSFARTVTLDAPYIYTETAKRSSSEFQEFHPKGRDEVSGNSWNLHCNRIACFWPPPFASTLALLESLNFWLGVCRTSSYKTGTT